MKLNRLVMASLIGISLSTPAWACDPGKGGLFSFFHHSDSDHDKDRDSHHDHDGDQDHHQCNGGTHSGGGSSSGGGSTSTPPSGPAK
jgi:hypothetical protein